MCPTTTGGQGADDRSPVDQRSDNVLSPRLTPMLKDEQIPRAQVQRTERFVRQYNAKDPVGGLNAKRFDIKRYGVGCAFDGIPQRTGGDG
ncbi:MAG: hypothetical protein H7A47_13410 [Verrucomicrobiales bacterium]|nr:hypothetical protein [Verrucomicrobiales bacterium]